MMKPKDFGTCLNHLDASDLLEQLKQWLQIHDDGAYQKWKEEEFDINHRFVFDPSGQDNINKLTLLSIAVKYSNEKVVQALLEAGADPKEAKRELIGIVTQQAINKARKVGSICSAIVMIGAICCVMTTYAVILVTLLAVTADISILGAAIIAPAVVAGLVGGIITYAISKPSENLDRANAVIKKIISDCESKGLLKGYINEQSLNTNKSIITGAICGAIVMIGAICGAVAAFTILTGLTGSGLDGVGLSILTFIGVAIVAVVTGLVAGGIIYEVYKPCDELKEAIAKAKSSPGQKLNGVAVQSEVSSQSSVTV